MTTVAADTVSPLGARAGLRDFSDRLSPMLVKELHQGLKSPAFIWGLIALQIAMAVMAVVQMENGTSTESTLAFWWSLAAIVCILLPMRVANALRDEMGGNTMDTLVLTRLSAWRITLGKWLATSALQVLVAITVMPYLTMRYFAGGVNLPVEMACMAVFLTFGLLVTAIMLGLSWFRYFLVRAGVMLAVLFWALAGCVGLMETIEDVNSYGLDRNIEILGWPGVVWCSILAAWLGFFFLDLGVAQIAPLSENRATRRRLAAVILFAAGGACALWSKELQVRVVLAALLFPAVIIVCVQALCERPANFAPVLLPFVKRGAAGRLAGRILYPGWHTGLVFTLLVLGLAEGLAIYMYNLLLAERMAAYGDESGELPNVLSVLGGIAGAMILPLVICLFFRAMPRWNFWRWLTVLICAGLVHGAIMLIAETSAGLGRANLALPTGGFCVPVMASRELQEEWQRWRRVQIQLEEQEGQEAKVRKEAGLTESRPTPPRRISHLEFYDWADREKREKEITANLCAYSLVSLAVWLGIATFMALKEMRETRCAENELAAALAGHSQQPVGTAG